jgi:ABC-2 type transport system permease protein
MKNVWFIAKKEIRAYFNSPIAYVVITVFLVLTGYFFYNSIWWFNNQAMEAAQNPYYYQQLNINQMVFGPLFHNISIILLLVMPLLTMRLLAEEKKIGTEELLFTSPLSVNQIILGKFLGALFILAVMLLLTAIPTALTFSYGNPQLAPVLIGYLGLFLMGAAFIAVGLFYSSLTENQIVAAVLAFGTLLLFLIMNWAAYSAGGVWRGVLNYLSFFQHFDGLTQGMVDTQDLVYYFSFAFFGLFLTHSVIQSRRWR